MAEEVKVVYVPLEGGFWGLEDKAGKKYLPINFPEQLKIKNALFKVSFVTLDGMMSFAQWGTLVKLTAFEF